MGNIISFISLLYSAIESSHFLIAVIILSFSIKTYFLGILIPHGLRASKFQKPWFLLLGILAGSMFGDIAWVIKLMRELVFPNSSYAFVTFSIRIAWGFLILQYQSLAFFIESLSEKNFKLRLFHKILLIISSSFAFYFFYLAFFESALTDEHERELAKLNFSTMPFELKAMRYVIFYLINLLVFPSLFFTFKNMRANNLPKILKKQLFIFVLYLLGPYLATEFLQMANFMFKSFEAYLKPIISISTLLLSYTVYYCIKRVIGLRFLNFSSHVQSSHTFNFIDDFKNLLEQLSYATSVQELGHLTQSFFKQAFEIPLRKTNLYFRKLSMDKSKEAAPSEGSKIEDLVENFMSTHALDVCTFISKYKVLIYDEIAFTNFYEGDSVKKTILTFLENINADVFLPIYEKQKIVAYVIIERHARHQEFYSNIEHDEMVVFASYLGNIYNLLKNRSFEALIHQEKELREELYSKHQEINQYKESIRSFLRTSKQKEIGIIFYKSRRFIFGNQAAKELVKINLNTQEGHPLAKAFREIARQVEEYKSPQTLFTKDIEGTILVLSGVHNLEQSNVIITVYYPEVSDIIIKQIDQLKDPTKWDYLLYLETTESGQLINQLIPGSGENLLNFKIQLLKTALSKKATLLEIPHDDLIPTVELLHHISLRESLHGLDLQGPEKNFETAIKLFGINPIFGIAPAHKPLLKKLDNNGTLFIKNIQFLDFETQEYLAEFIRFGYYRVFKSDQKVPSNVRIICSTSQNLHTLVHEGKFSQALFNELKKTIISMPSLMTLPEQELNNLAEGYIEQAIKTDTFKNFLDLTEKEKANLALKRPISLQELKTKIQNLLIQKSRKNNIDHETQLDPAYSITDPELIAAARLGKHALREPKMLAMLWNKFKNQNQIATFLGVNRSSVNRRCKEFNLE